jgi:Holliday junction resolvase RusA-like endonuclease
MTYSELTLHFDIRPTPHQSFRRGRNGIAYTPKKILDFKKSIAYSAMSQVEDGFEIIRAGTPIIVEHLHYCFAFTKSTALKRRIIGMPKATKPDLLDNLNKAFIDALEGTIFEQDQNIVEVRDLRKFYGESDYIEIKLLY